MAIVHPNTPDYKNYCKDYPELSESDIQNIQEWISKNPHLPKVSDWEIFIFLRFTNFSVEVAKIKLEMFYTARTLMKDIFSNRDVTAEEIRYVKDFFATIMLPKRSPNGYDIAFMKILDPSKFTFKNLIKRVSFAGEVESGVGIPTTGLPNGYIVIVDLEGAKIQHLGQVDMVQAKQYMNYVQETVPYQLRGIHILNPPTFMNEVMVLLKMIFKTEIMEVLHIHKSLKELEKYIPLDILPNDYKGGKGKSVIEMNDEYYEYLAKNRDFYMLEEKTRRTNENLRQAKLSQVNSDLFGAQGNFKRLDID